ncbi:unnamed protein product [Prorocentrum cordatum]|uniref:Fe2OG dioxygenase domain-containing protein n=1 Tax=Prorocentrum cordatum TaxID=2364126 RepID=A0ABN9QHG5_9DINO|nr:unnamed protein product [Polarella glacialis]
MLLAPPVPRDIGSPGGGCAQILASEITSSIGADVAVFWVNDLGEESPTDVIISPAEDGLISTFTGHAFRIRTDDSAKTLVAELEVSETTARANVAPCGVVPPVQANRRDARKSELDGLVHDQFAPCDPPGKSGLWSCVRKIPKEEYSQRLADPPPEYGFANKEEAGGRKVHEQWDYGYTGHIRQVPRVANTSGFLKMSFTSKLKDILMPFWKDYGIGGVKDSVAPHGVIAGGYTNSHTIPMSKLDLDKHRDIQRKVHMELKDYLEWWTGRPLTHTSTFGIRIYHRGSMLIDHVDRADTHLASAVIQVGQDVDEDGGWPLEVIDEEGNCFEVYLQPGELVLYEGGRFRHGRPMRFKGNHFANIFSHFAPLEWKGPGKSPKFDGHLDEHGWLLSDEDEVQRHLEI